MYTDRTQLNSGIKLTPSLILCCMCGKQIESNAYNCCYNCLTKKIDVAEGIPLKTLIHHCRQCNRWLSTNSKWYKCAPESKELLQLCLSKINQLKFLTILETGWVFIDESQNELKVKVNIQKEVLNNIQLTKEVVIVFEISRIQCDDCRKSFTPHVYTCKVQVRQNALQKELKRNMLYLEQLILKHRAHMQCSTIETFKDGVDFKFNDVKYGTRFTNFLKAVMPIQIDTGKELVSYNEQNAEYRYKTNFSVHIAPVNKDELCAIDKVTCQKLGISLGMYLCWRVTTQIHLINPLNMHRIDLTASKYFDLKNNITTVIGRTMLKKQHVLDVERDFKNIIDLRRNNDDLMSEGPSRSNKSEIGSRTGNQNDKNADILNHNPNRGFLYAKSENGLSVYNSAWSQSTTAIMKRLQKMVHSYVTITPDDDMSKTYCVKSHLGNILKEGDVVWGQDMDAFQMPDSLLEKTCYNPSDYQDVQLVKRHFERKKNKTKFKLKRLNDESMVDEDELEFVKELESDPEMRSRINLQPEEPMTKIKEATEEAENEDENGKGKAKTNMEEEDDWEDADDDELEVKLCELVDDIEIKE